MANKRVLVVGSAEKSGGGVASVIKLIKKMSVWHDYHCYWLGTQIQRNYIWKVWYALKSYIVSLFIIWRYDIVHFHTVPNISMLVQLPIFILAIIGGKKIILHIHVGNQLSHHQWDKLFKWHLRHANLVILLAKKWQQLFEKEYEDIKVPTAVLYNACDFVPKVPFDKKEKIIIMAAFFNDNKAPDLLLKAWQKIKDQYQDWQIYMLGNGEVDRFRKMSDNMGLSESVHFEGYVTGKVKESFYKRASIMAVCSYEEGFPMVVLEAWAYGICVVTTPVGGLPDVLEDGKNALKYDFGDWNALACHLSNLMDNENKRLKLAEYSRQFVSNRFSLKAIDAELKKIYQTKLS